MEVAGVLVTADSVRDGLDQDLVRDLIAQTGMKILHEEVVIINANHARLLYPNLVERNFFSHMVTNMTSGPSRVLIVEGSGVFQKLKQAKGLFKQDGMDVLTTGLRRKYRSGTREELEERGYSGLALDAKLQEFRVHTTDNPDETRLFCEILLGRTSF